MFVFVVGDVWEKRTHGKRSVVKLLYWKTATAAVMGGMC